MVFADKCEQQLRQEVDQLAALLQQPALPQVFVVYAHPPRQQVQHESQQLYGRQDGGVVVEQDPVAHYFALDFCDFELRLLPDGVAFGELPVDVFHVFLDVFLHIVEHGEVFHGPADPHMEKLQRKEEKLRDGSKLFGFEVFLEALGADGVRPQLLGLLVAQKVAGVDGLPLVLLLVGDHLAESQKAAVDVDQQPVMRQFHILRVIQPVSQLHPAQIAHQQPIVPLQKHLPRLLPHKLPVRIAQFSRVLRLRGKVDPYFLLRKSVVAQLLHHPLFEALVSQSLLVDVAADPLA